MEEEREESPRRKKQRPNDSGRVVDDARNMQRYLVTVEYIGSRYLGFQKQRGRDCRTVQGALEIMHLIGVRGYGRTHHSLSSIVIQEAFSKFVGKQVESAGSSRTDTGVHAMRNVCHVDVERVSKRKPGEILPPHEPAVVKRAVNHFLQKNGEDVQVVDVRCVPRNFHARFEAKERTYLYRMIVSSKSLSVFERNRAWHISGQLNVPAMQQACRYLVGHHDFSSFRAAGCQAKSPVKTLDELHVCEMPLWLPCPSEALQTQCCDESLRDLNEEKVCLSGVSKSTLNLKTAGLEHATLEALNKQDHPRCYVITARARSFLYHQVRLMVGLLKAVGTGEVQINTVPVILESRTVTRVPPMAPACGLYLANVKYQLDT